ncbi:MAG: polyamine aminopropyltransferase [Armatimonadota bacterium]
MLKTKQRHWYVERAAQGEGEAHIHAIDKTYFSGYTKFQSVDVMENPTYGKMLILDDDIQSTSLDEFIYHESLVYPALVLHKNPKNAVILGGGEGATARDLLYCKTMGSVEMVDIDGEVVDLCEKYLPEWSDGAFKNEKVKLVVDDARKYMEETSQKYDVIISDLTEPTSDGPSHKLFTKDFFEILQKRLNEGGVFVLQASTGDVHNLRTHTVIRNTLKQVFKYTRSFISRVPAYDTIWTFVLCSDTRDPLTLSEEEIDKTISNLITKPLRYYDSITHKHMFNLPKYFREAIDKQTEVLRDGVKFQHAPAAV